MSFDQSQIDGVLKKLGAADLQILAAQLVPALAADLVSLLPAAYQPIAQVIEASAVPALSASLQAMVAKVQL